MQSRIFSDTVSGHRERLHIYTQLEGSQRGAARNVERWLRVDRLPELILRAFKAELAERKPQELIGPLK
jgi:hypothetical protein